MYNGDHSITFINSDGVSKNTWDDWFLIPSERPVFAIPQVRTKTVEIPGMDGSLDLTDYLTGSPVLGDSTGSFTFIIDNDHGEWAPRYREFINFLHGKRLMAILSDDPGYYYEGRFQVAWTPGQTWSQLTINYVINVFGEEVPTSPEDD